MIGQNSTVPVQSAGINTEISGKKRAGIRTLFNRHKQNGQTENTVVTYFYSKFAGQQTEQYRL
jgi:hypothetical protein